MSFTQERRLWEIVLQQCKEMSFVRPFASFHHLDIFGMYFILRTSNQGQKYFIKSPEQAAEHMRIEDVESLREIGCQLLINVSKGIV